MFRGASARFDRGTRSLPEFLRRNPFLELLSGISRGTRIGVAVGMGLLACFGGQMLSAQADPHKLLVQRTPLAIPHKFTVHPEEATVALNQTQRFEVTDAQGNPVAVHWNVSGLGCSSSACGTIDDQGIYRTPSSLPHPLVITVEGVLVSDPNYSVLTQVRLADSVTATRGADSRTTTAKAQPSAAPEFATGFQTKSLANTREKEKSAPPLPDAVAAAPSVGTTTTTMKAARNAELPAPTVIAAAPSVQKKNLASKSDLPAPDVIGAAPNLASQNLARTAALPTPSVIGPAPSVATPARSRTAELPAASVIAAAPSVGKKDLAGKTKVDLPTPNVVAAAPSVASQNLAHTAELPTPNVVSAAASPASQKLTQSTSLLTTALPTASLPAPSPVAAAPSKGKKKLDNTLELSTLSVVATGPSVASTPSVAAARSTAPPTTPAQNVARNTALPIGTGSPATQPVASTIANNTGANNTGATSHVAPGVETPNPAMLAMLSPAPNPVSAARTQPLTIPAAKPQPLAAPATVPATVQTTIQTTTPATTPAPAQNVSSGNLLSQMSDASAAASTGTIAVTHAGPVVTYRDGLLAIDVVDSTLADVLKLIAEKTGAVIDIPPGAGQERIIERTGPAQPNEVLQRLLNGSSFNFIIVSSPLNPNQPAQVLLSLHKPDSDANTAVTASVQPSPAASAGPQTPPAPAHPVAMTLPYELDPHNFQPPKEPMSPEAIGQLMKEKGQQILEELRKQQPPQPQPQ